MLYSFGNDTNLLSNKFLFLSVIGSLMQYKKENLQGAYISSRNSLEILKYIMNICVIGGSGFVGTKLISSLLGKNLVINIDKAKSILHPEYPAWGMFAKKKLFW